MACLGPNLEIAYSILQKLGKKLLIMSFFLKIDQQGMATPSGQLICQRKKAQK